MAILEDPKEPVVIPKTIEEQPGGLRSDTRMTIQTREAQKLVVGRRGGKGVQPIIGLLTFGRRMKLIWMAAQNDDPYADWFLLRIESSLEDAREFITEKRKWLDDVLSSLESFDISIATSLEPIVVHINFQNPYGYMGAYLIADYDALCRSVFTAIHIGLIDRKTGSSVIHSAGRAIRRTFELSAQWKLTSINREDVRVKTERALKAIALFGECPEPVLNKEKRAKIAPDIRVKTKPVGAVIKSDRDSDDKGGKDGREKTSLRQKLTLKSGKKSRKPAAKSKNEAEKREAVAASLLSV
jgi:integrating conjugative element protein (TIGR03761 family)